LGVRFRAPGTFRINRAAQETVLGRIGIDDRSRGAAPLGLIHLETAVRVRVGVPHQHDLALEIDAHAIQQLEIFRAAAIRIHDFRAHLSRWRITMKGDLRRIVIKPRVLVGGVVILTQVQTLFHGCPDRERRRLRKAQERRKLVKANLVEAVLAKTVAHVFRERVIALRAGHVRFFGEVEQVLAVGASVRRGGQNPLGIRRRTRLRCHGRRAAQKDREG